MPAMRRGLKRAIKAAVKYTALGAGWIAPRHGACPRILTYHSIGYRDHDMNVLPAAFRAQMQWLVSNTRVIPLAEAAAGIPGVAITFDDGYRDNLTYAAPILSELKIPATVFVVAGRAGGMLDHDDDAETARLMSWDEIRELAAMGVEIGAHSLTHPRLAALTDEAQRVEIEACSRAFEEHLGRTPDVFAYPFGSAADYTAETVRIVRDCGFKYALSNRYGVNEPGADPWTLRRIWIDASDTMLFFRAKVTGRLDALALFEAPAGLAARRILNRIATGRNCG